MIYAYWTGEFIAKLALNSQPVYAAVILRILLPNSQIFLEIAFVFWLYYWWYLACNIG